jgi:hypothetical protein
VPTYPSLYRAKATNVTGLAVMALIPQVFGEAPVTVTRFLGLKPLSGGFGWVFFEGGNPEFPVWAAAGTDIVIGPGGIDGVQTIVPGPGIGVDATDPFHPTVSNVGIIDITGGTNVSVDKTNPRNPIINAAGGSGGGTDEVWIGADDPIIDHPSIELWYDTDDDYTAVDRANFWNSAWGVLATAKATASSWNNATATLTTITVTTGSNFIQAHLYPTRKYRLYWQCQVTSTVAGDQMVIQPVVNGATYPENNVVRIGAANTGEFTWFESYYSPPTEGDYQIWMAGRRSSGSTGTVSVFNIGNAPMWLLIEDMGPLSPAAVNPPTGQPQIATAGNALGIVAVGSLKASPVTGVVSTPTDVTNPISFTTVTGRRYRLRFNARAVVGSAANSCVLNLYIDSTFVGDVYTMIPASSYNHVPLEWVFNGDGGTHTYNVAISSGVTTTMYTDGGSCYFYIEDIGPNTTPALPLPAVSDVVWLPLSPATGWAAPGGATEWPVSVSKVGDQVRMRGSVQRTTGAIGNTIFQLPAGFYRTDVFIRLSGGGFEVGGTPYVWRADLATGGGLVITGCSSASSNYFTFNGVTWTV